MRITFQRQGGIAFIPGLTKPVVIDTGQLAAALRADLEQLVRAARFFALPATVGMKQRGAADYREYTVTVEDGGRSSTVHFIEPFNNSAVEELIAVLESHAHARAP